MMYHVLLYLKAMTLIDHDVSCSAVLEGYDLKRS